MWEAAVEIVPDAATEAAATAEAAFAVPISNNGSKKNSANITVSYLMQLQ